MCSCRIGCLEEWLSPFLVAGPRWSNANRTTCSGPLADRGPSCEIGGPDVAARLDRIESGMGSAPSQAQWTMNFCLGEIGIRFAGHRARATAIGEKLGLYRDYPVSKGCTSPFVPTWIAEMVRRRG